MSVEDKLRGMGFDDEQIAGARTADGKLLSKPKLSDGWPGYKSKWEAMYAMELGDQLLAKQILDWGYERVSLLLTEATIVDGKRKPAVRYRPDFDVWLPDHRLRFVEIKGYRREAGMVRYKMAKDKFRYAEFVMLTRGENGGWKTIL